MRRIQMSRTVVGIRLIAYLLLFFTGLAEVFAKRPSKINILFIVVDDLRGDVAPYADTYEAFTPNMRRLSRSAMTFENAYTQHAVCGPSRNSFLSGRRPDSLRSWNFLNSMRKFSNQIQTIPQLFKKAGYETISIGKVFHIYEDIGDDAKNSWNTVLYRPGLSDDDTNCARNSIWCNCDAGGCIDDLIAQSAVGIFKARAKVAEASRKPWFMALGFRRPHPDFAVDPNFASFANFSMPIASQQVAPNFAQPNGMPLVAFYSCNGILSRSQFQGEPLLPWTPVNPDMQARVRLAYWRSAAYMDAQLGVVLDALDASPFAENTIVTFTSDHGFHLGERSMWCKQSVFESTTRVPLMIRVPWLNDTTAGKSTSTIAELIDLFPTLVSLVGNSSPSPMTINDCGEGKDLLPSIKDPLATESANQDDAGGIDLISDVPDFSATSFAISQYPRCIEPQNAPNVWSNPCTFTNNFAFMGYSIRTNRWRYTEWRVWLGPAADWSSSGLNATELYDHTGDVYGRLSFDTTENVNVANLHPLIVAKLSLALRIAVIGVPSSKPLSCRPKGFASAAPTKFPTARPSTEPSANPTERPTVKATRLPTSQAPTRSPTAFPTQKTGAPSSLTKNPTRTPSTQKPTLSPILTRASLAPSTKNTSTPSMPTLPPVTQTNKPTKPMTPSLTPSTSGDLPEVSPTPTDVPTSPIDASECRDTEAFCEMSDWTCGKMEQCSSKGEELLISCPCWSYSTELVELQENSATRFLCSNALVWLVTGLLVFVAE